MRNRQSKAKQNCEAASSIHLKVSAFTFCYNKCLALYISTWYLLWQDKKSDQERWSLSRHFDAEIARAFAWNFYGIFQIPGGRLRSWIDFHECNKLFGSQSFSLNFHWKVLGILKLLRMYRIVMIFALFNGAKIIKIRYVVSETIMTDNSWCLFKTRP